MRVIVVGAGLGGLTLAQGLRRAGIDVVVYEREEPRGRPQGVSMHFDDRGMTALRACLPPGHVAMVEATMGGPREQALTLSETDGELTVERSQTLDGTKGPARPGRQVDRPLLRAVMLTGLEDTVRFGAPFARFQQLADGTVRAWSADGRTEVADVLVGADGIGSAVRRQYLPHVQVVDTGKRMMMGATPLRHVAGTGLPELIGHSAARAQVRGTMMAMGILRFTQPPVAARTECLPALDSRAVDDAEDYVMWALPVTEEQLGTAESPAAVWGQAQELVSGLPEVLRTLVDSAWPDRTVVLRNGMIPPPPAWPAGSVTLIGDAIHVTPGFGGNLAMQDAHRLCAQLVQAARGEKELHAAIATYEDVMRHENFTTPTASRPAEAAVVSRGSGG
ncbi:FAD-dependent oxidoreductase [Kribbella solani]|uniref:FAD-dependent oxidoreductase n=1 Tax=Kribbella solani TaxID=236067 RepID=UPI0029B5ADCC|nr:NAD(P)/FAD-dependent oxidoreductase [Kribbella solani]MDX2968117.1 NAD(P)/FAD-dependent oxidoreductase [Kribbella solani]